jgi:osmotically-inducible protein OsmY
MNEESRAAQVERAIREIAELDVVVEESDGVITLEGIVDSERDREAAEDIAADLAGDAEIDNALEVQDTLPVSVDSFNDERRSADAEESVTADERADAQIEPDFTSLPLTDDPQAVSGPTSSADQDDSVDDGDVAYVPPIDPVATPGQEGRELIVGGFSLSALDEDPGGPLADDLGYGDEAIADAVRRELREDAATTDLMVRVAVRNGVVFLHGSVADVDDAEAAEEVASRVTGVREVRESIDVGGEA